MKRKLLRWLFSTHTFFKRKKEERLTAEAKARFGDNWIRAIGFDGKALRLNYATSHWFSSSCMKGAGFYDIDTDSFIMVMKDENVHHPGYTYPMFGVTVWSRGEWTNEIVTI